MSFEMSMDDLLAERVDEIGAVVLGPEDVDSVDSVDSVEATNLPNTLPAEPQADQQAEPYVDDELVELIAKMEADGYSDRTICHAVGVTTDELVMLRQSEASNGLRDARREAFGRSMNVATKLDTGWDDVEARAIASLKLELADANMLDVGEKLSIARAANAAKRKRERESELEAKRRAAGMTNEAISLTQNNVITLNLPNSMIEAIQQAGKRSRDAFSGARRVGAEAEIGAEADSDGDGDGDDYSPIIDMTALDELTEREQQIAASVDPSTSRMDFETAGRVLGVDLDEVEGAANSANSANSLWASGRSGASDALAETNSGYDTTSIIASQAG